MVEAKEENKMRSPAKQIQFRDTDGTPSSPKSNQTFGEFGGESVLRSQGNSGLANAKVVKKKKSSKLSTSSVISRKKANDTT